MKTSVKKCLQIKALLGTYTYSYYTYYIFLVVFIWIIDVMFWIMFAEEFMSTVEMQLSKKMHGLRIHSQSL